MERNEENLMKLYEFIKGESDPQKMIEEEYKAEAEDEIFTEIRQERIRQNQKWGEQTHPDGTGDSYYFAMQELIKGAMDKENPDWAHILLEEVYEALSEKEDSPLEEELVQVAAVCVAWLRDIKMRRLLPPEEEKVEGTEEDVVE